MHSTDDLLVNMAVNIFMRFNVDISKAEYILFPAQSIQGP